jgi:integrase
MAFYLKLRKLDSSGCQDFLVKQTLKGAENLEFYKSFSSSCRKVMSFPLLKILSHSIATQSWPECDKQCFWTAYAVAFYGSFRFGELVSESENSFNERDTLLWSDITFGNDFVVIHVKIAKNRKKDGEYIDLFLQPDNHYCPVKALMRLKKLTAPCKNDPVFKLKNGTFLTTTTINNTLHKLLTPFLGEAAKSISGHSFRAALASALASRPDLATSDDVRNWGRWSSSSFLLYTRLKLNQKRVIFNKVISVLKN